MGMTTQRKKELHELKKLKTRQRVKKHYEKNKEAICEKKRVVSPKKSTTPGAIEQRN